MFVRLQWSLVLRLNFRLLVYMTPYQNRSKHVGLQLFTSDDQAKLNTL